MRITAWHAARFPRPGTRFRRTPPHAHRTARRRRASSDLRRHRAASDARARRCGHAAPLAPDLDEDGPLLLDALRAAGAGSARRPPGTTTPSTGARSTRCSSAAPGTTRCAGTSSSPGRSCAAGPPIRPTSLAWNTDKRYLDDLSRAGVATVPTVFVDAGRRRPARLGLRRRRRRQAGGQRQRRRHRTVPGPPTTPRRSRRWSRHSTPRAGRRWCSPTSRASTPTARPSLVFLGGRFSHAVRREPLLGGTASAARSSWRTCSPPCAPSRPPWPSWPWRTDAGRRPGRPRSAWATPVVDVIPGPGGPVLLELEATDCFLFLSFAAPAAPGPDGRARAAAGRRCRTRGDRGRAESGIGPGVLGAALEAEGLLLHHRGELAGAGARLVTVAQRVADLVVDHVLRGRWRRRPRSRGRRWPSARG